MLLLSTEGNLNDISFDFDHQLKVRNGYVCNSSGYNYGTFKEFFKKDVREYFEEKFSINVVRTHPNAKLPTRGTKYAAGLDLYSIDEINIPGNSTVCVNTGIKIEIPIGQYGRIAERSGLALKGIAVGGGVIDSDYRGEIKVILRNTNVNKEAAIFTISEFPFLLIHGATYQDKIRMIDTTIVLRIAVLVIVERMKAFHSLACDTFFV